jgi:2'-5' RNA ligase
VSDTARAFFAVDLPAEGVGAALEAIAALREAIPASAARFVEASQLHLTLKFLGDVERPTLERLGARAAARLAGEIPFTVGLSGLGAFPDRGRARVVWLGVDEGQAALARLARKLERASTPLGIERERRPYRAHLTLARLREPRAVEISRVEPPERVSFPVEEVVLYESRLASTGATHLPLARLPLGLAIGSSDIDFAPER